MMLILMRPRPRAKIVRTTISIDDELLAKATRLLGPLDRSGVNDEGLRAMIDREGARRLARLGDTRRRLKAAPRRRRAE